MIFEYSKIMSVKMKRILNNLPQISLIGSVFDMITNCLKHATCRCYIPTIKNLEDTINSNKHKKCRKRQLLKQKKIHPFK